MEEGDTGLLLESLYGAAQVTVATLVTVQAKGSSFWGEA